MGDGAADPDPRAGEQDLESCASFSTLSKSVLSMDAAYGADTIIRLPGHMFQLLLEIPS